MRDDMRDHVIVVTGGAGFIGSAVVRHLVGDCGARRASMSMR